MKLVIAIGVLLALSSCAAPPPRGLIIAHRGASGYLPEHTLASYALAHGLGADYIEPDVVLTRDQVPICAHDLYAEAVTNAREVFPAKARPDGHWYWCDMTLAEARQLRVRGREPNQTSIEGLRIATLDEMICLIHHMNVSRKRRVGIIPELKDPAFHESQGLPADLVLLQTLHEHGYRTCTDGAIIQCFDLPALHRLRSAGCQLRLVWLIKEAPDDAQLAGAAAVVNGLGPARTLVENDDGSATDLVRRAHAVGLSVFPYTFKAEHEAAVRFLRDHGADGVFTDHPDVLRLDADPK